jgi:hypothetical protein
MCGVMVNISELPISHKKLRGGRIIRVVRKLSMVLIFFALIASVSALDVWSGSNNKVSSGSGTVAGLNGLTFINNAPNGILLADLEANAAITDGAPGVALADWSIPTPYTENRSRLIDGTLHDLTIVFGGHVQAGIEKTSVNGAGDAQARISTSIIPTATADTGTALIRSQLRMNGQSSGYAIADGIAGFSAMEKLCCVNDLFKVAGTAMGKVDIRGATFAGTDTETGALLSSMAAGAEIESTATAGNVAGTAASESHIMTDKTGPYKPVQIGNGGYDDTSIDVTNGATNGIAWDASSPIVKTTSNANALTEVGDTIHAKMITWKEDSSAGVGPLVGDSDMAEITEAGISAVAASGIATTAVGSSVKIQRTASSPNNKVTAEAFVRDGSWNAVSRADSFNLLQATGALGGVFDGIASAAHLISSSGTTTNPIPIYSGQELIQTALPAGVRTSAVLTKQAASAHATEGPTFTANIDDDAGSYFSTTGYTTTSTVGLFSTFQTSVAPSWDVKWLSGNDPHANIYFSGFDWTAVGSVSPTELVGSSVTTNPRWLDITFGYNQP